MSHSWNYKDDNLGISFVINHNNESHSAAPVHIIQMGPDKGDTPYQDPIVDVELPFGLLLDFVAEMLQRDARAHQDDISPEDWLRAQIGAPKR